MIDNSAAASEALLPVLVAHLAYLRLLALSRLPSVSWQLLASTKVSMFHTYCQSFLIRCMQHQSDLCLPLLPPLALECCRLKATLDDPG